ncbi:MAG: hypothetical protein L6W00_16495 [Lentisphaeria bacterium]|nr:MAG: hypothetical protein L6W00_16495 [Lentisphaeria bacterium]
MTDEGRFSSIFGEFELQSRGMKLQPGGNVTAAIRPERIRVTSTPCPGSFPRRADRTELSWGEL